jgi:hypothetical protein
MFSHLSPETTETHQLGTIHPEHLNNGVASWSQTNDFYGIVAPGKVLAPLLLLRMKQGGTLAKRRDDARLSIGLVAVTGGTSQTEIIEARFTAGTSRNNMLDFKDGYGERFGSLTIGTAVRKPGSDLTPQCGGNIDTHDVCNAPD